LAAYRPLRHDDPDEHFHFNDEDYAYDEVLTDEIQAEDILGLEAFRQQSVGVDIGSSTSHLIFSELTLRRDGESSRIRVTGRRILYRSAILLTPYLSATQIDAPRLQGFIERTYADAGVRPDEVDTGAVVITGEALKKENARPILEMFSRQTGKFICASAGPNHEALLAAFGSGAVAASRDNHWRVLLVDMGGGTTKFALIENGHVVETGAINIGARLIAFNAEGVLTRIEEPARIILGASNGALTLGSNVSQEVKSTLTDRMVESLFDVILGRPASVLTDELMITAPLQRYRGLDGIDRVMFSGGVSEYVYGRDNVAYGDLGPLLGQGVRTRFTAIGRSDIIETSVSGIRATVVGAGEYTVQASGTTSCITDREVLPVFGMQVVKPEATGVEGLEAALRSALKKYDLTEYTDGFALALTTDGALDYAHLKKVAEGLAGLARTADPSARAIFIILDADIAKTLGALLKEEGVAQEIIAVDGIDVGDLDFIDIGQPMGSSEVMPVTVKSLIFPTKIKI
jgi:ethanolamine utilization protein EutA